MAALYTAQQVGITAPSGGFQNLGWYSGRQYSAENGMFSDAGVINPGSNQIGAGQAVSKEVNAQSDAAQGLKPGTIDAYVAKQNQQPIAPAAQTGGGSQINGGSDASITGGGSAVGGAGVGYTAPAPALNLPDLYKSLTDSAGVNDLEKSLTDKQQSFNDAQSKINDNPFLSEGERTGRVEKLQIDYNNDIKSVQDELAMKKQDIQTQLDLQTKQFDINSQTAKAALDQFNTLLSSGALAGASGQDIAAITKATGISSSEIQSAIRTQTVKDTPTSVQTVDDGKNIYAVTLNTKTGQVISKTVIGNSKPLAPTAQSEAVKLQQAGSNVVQFLDSVKNSYGNVSPADWSKARSAYIQDGGTAAQFNADFSAYTDPNRGDFNNAYGFDIKTRGGTTNQVAAQTAQPAPTGPSILGIHF